jgi:hypothetical protein
LDLPSHLAATDDSKVVTATLKEVFVSCPSVPHT